MSVAAKQSLAHTLASPGSGLICAGIDPATGEYYNSAYGYLDQSSYDSLNISLVSLGQLAEADWYAAAPWAAAAMLASSAVGSVTAASTQSGSSNTIPASWYTANPNEALYLTEPGDTSAISIYDINQGQIGDCFLLSSIGEIALWHSADITNMIQINPRQRGD